MPLDLAARKFLEMLHRIDAPHLSELPLEIARRNFAKMLYLYRDAPREDVVVDICSIERRPHEGGPLEARLYRPEACSGQRLPVLLWLHGGGWTVGDMASYDPLCRQIAQAAQCAVFALEYRLAPENRFPAALDDAWKALQHLRTQGAAWGLDTQRMAVGGDSAGGNLAAVLALMARDAGLPLAGQLLIYPAVDLTQEWSGDAPYQEGHFLDAASMRWFVYNYLDVEAERYDWRVSPMRAPSHANLAPAVVMTAECDPLTPAAQAYADRLKAAGNPVRYEMFASTIHGFLTFPRLFEAADQAIRTIAQSLQEDFGFAQRK